jgi:hypothetical protein
MNARGQTTPDDNESTTGRPASAASGDAVLRRRIASFAADAHRAADALRSQAAPAVRESLDGVVDAWVANVCAQLDLLERFAAGAAPPLVVRSEVQRARRDLARWMRVLAERAEAQARSDAPAAIWAACAERLVAAVGALGTISAPTDPAIFAAEAGDRLPRLVRKRLAARVAGRGDAPRGVPLQALARHYALAPLLDKQAEWANRYGAARIAAWRALRRVALELRDALERIDRTLGEGGRPDWAMLRDAVHEWGEGVKVDLSATHGEIHARIDRDIASALAALEYAAMRSGTFLLPARVYESGPSESACEAAVARARSNADGWARLAQGTCAGLAVVLDADAYLAAVRYAHFRDGAVLDSLLASRLVEPASELVARVAAARDRVSDVDSFDGAGNVLRDVRETLHAFIGERCVLPIRDPLLRNVAQDAVAELRRSTSRATQRLGAGFRVSFDKDLRFDEGDDPPPAPRHEVHPRSVADAVLTHAIEANIETTWRLLQALFDETRERVEELVRAVDFHFEMAARQASGELADASTLTMASLGVDQVVERAELLERRVTEARHAVMRGVAEPVPEAIAEFGRRIDDLLTSRPAAVRSETVVVPALGVGGHETGVRGDLLERFGRQVARGRAGDALIEVKTRRQLAEAMRFASFESLREGPLPEGYVRLFRSSNEVIGTAKFGIQDVVERIRGAVAAWEEGDPEAVAVVGLAGIGKGAVLDRVLEDLVDVYAPRRVVLSSRLLEPDELARTLSAAIGLPSTDSVDDLAQQLNASESRRAVLVEGGELLFLRHPRGLRAARALLSLVTRTADQVFWVVSFERVAFDFLLSVLHLSDAFTQVAEIDLLDRDEVEQLILTRHRVSGLALTFAAEIDPDGDEQVRQRVYFDALRAASHGHPVLAAWCWLRSLREFNSQGQILVGPVNPLPRNLLTPLDGVRRAAIATLLLHGGLDRTSFAQAMRLPGDESASLLAQLRHMHLVSVDANGIHEVNAVALMAIHEELRGGNVL